MRKCPIRADFVQEHQSRGFLAPIDDMSFVTAAFSPPTALVRIARSRTYDVERLDLWSLTASLSSLMLLNRNWCTCANTLDISARGAPSAGSFVGEIRRSTGDTLRPKAQTLTRKSFGWRLAPAITGSMTSTVF